MQKRVAFASEKVKRSKTNYLILGLRCSLNDSVWQVRTLYIAEWNDVVIEDVCKECAKMGAIGFDWSWDGLFESKSARHKVNVNVSHFLMHSRLSICST